MSSIEKNQNLALLDIDRAITEGHDMDTINILQDMVRLHDDQLHAIQEEARQLHGDNWQIAIFTEHQNVARELSTTAFLPTTLEEEGEDAEVTHSFVTSEAKASTSEATAPAGGGNAPAGAFDDIVTIRSGRVRHLAIVQSFPTMPGVTDHLLRLVLLRLCNHPSLTELLLSRLLN